MAIEGFRPWGVQCPFYKVDDNKRSITCEGIIDGSHITLSYRRSRDQRQQLEIFCCEHYKKCEIYRMLMRDKYDME